MKADKIKELKIITFPLKIDEATWKSFSKLIPRDVALNQALCNMVYQYIRDETEEVDPKDPEFQKWLDKMNKESKQ